MADNDETEVLDAPPMAPEVTGYDLAMANHYRRLLAAEAEGASWREAAALVLKLDCDVEPDKAERVHAAHLERARWMTTTGFRLLMRRSDTAGKP